MAHHDATPPAGAAASVFDRARALEAVAEDLELLQELIDLFLEDCPRMRDDMRSAVAARDADAVMRAAHALKGSVSVLGAPAASDAALELETRGRQGTMDGIEAAHARLEAELERLLPRLREVLDS